MNKEVLMVYKFPESAKFGRVIPKNRIYKHALPDSRTRALFVREVKKIIWSWKLSPATINVPPSDGVQEIQIFTIVSKTGDITQKVLHTIDKAIPSPILFELKYGGEIRYTASYKRPGESDRRKCVLSSYFQSDWTKDDSSTLELPVVLNMDMLYQSFLTNLSPLPLRQGEKLDSLVSRIDLLRAREHEAEKLKRRIREEKQFNRQVDLNRTLNTLKREISELKG